MFSISSHFSFSTGSNEEVFFLSSKAGSVSSCPFCSFARIESESKSPSFVSTLCDRMDYTVHGILQARILEWAAFPFFRDLPNPGIEPKSPTLQADSLPAESQGKPLICKMIKYLEHVKIPHRSFLRLLLKASSSAVCPRSLMFCFQISAFFLLQILILQA